MPKCATISTICVTEVKKDSARSPIDCEKQADQNACGESEEEVLTADGALMPIQECMKGASPTPFWQPECERSALKCAMEEEEEPQHEVGDADDGIATTESRDGELSGCGGESYIR